MPVNKNNAEKYFWGDNCESFVLADTEGLSVKQEIMPPGTREQLHFHQKAQQFFFILKGTAVFYCNNRQEVVNEQSGLLILSGTQHYIANESGGQLEFLVISQPSTNNDRINAE